MAINRFLADKWAKDFDVRVDGRKVKRLVIGETKDLHTLKDEPLRKIMGIKMSAPKWEDIPCRMVYTRYNEQDIIRFHVAEQEYKGWDTYTSLMSAVKAAGNPTHVLIFKYVETDNPAIPEKG